MSGGGRICECCTEITSLLQSYDGKRTPLSKVSDVLLSREEVETIFLYLQSWTQRQCNCGFRDAKNFDRFNWALQTLILIVVEVIKRMGQGQQKEEARAVHNLEDKDKLIHFVAKIFLNSFPIYVAYKQHGSLHTSEILPQELSVLSQVCEINEPEACPFLFRNVSLFCRAGGMEAITECLKRSGPESLLLHQVNILVTLATNVKAWLNFQTLLKFYVPLRSSALAYMCKLVETELKTVQARNMADYIWSAVKDPIDAHLSFDKDGLDLAFRYFLCPTLTMRLAGINQINNYINLFNELVNSEHIRDPDALFESLCSWLLDNQVVQHIFGPNLHVEVIKQSHTILSFLAMENQFTNEHVDVVWGAAQLKHCSKQVFDVLTNLICNMEPGPVLHLHQLLKQMEPKDHSEHSLYLATELIKFIWTNATSAMELDPSLPTTSVPVGSGSGGSGSVLSVPQSSSSPSTGSNVAAFRYVQGPQGKRKRTKGGPDPLRMELSSSENSVSVEASHSEGEVVGTDLVDVDGVGPMKLRPIPPVKIKQPLGSTGSESSQPHPHPSYFKPTCHLSGEETSSSSSDLSEDEDDNISVSDEEVHNHNLSYVEPLTHSDSDADEERSGNENDENVVPSMVQIQGKGKRKVLRRKKPQPSPVLKKVGGKQARLTRKVPDVSRKGKNGSSRNSHSIAAILKPDEVLAPGSDAILDPTVSAEASISQLGSMVQMRCEEERGLLQDFGTDLIEGSDGSYSSRMSTKSEKNMADFDGEDSNIEDDLQNFTADQLANLRALRCQEERKGRNSGTLLLPPRAMRMLFRRKRFQSPSTFNFQLENVCQPGKTLLWDLIQDDKIGQLSEGLAAEAQKSLTNLLCFGAGKLLRLKFIEGCIANLERNESVVVSLRLLPKLLGSFNQMRLQQGNGDVYQITLWAEREHHMLEKFFKNLEALKSTDMSKSPFPYHVHIQARLDFLSSVFSLLTSPDDFRLTVAQVDSLWSTMATDPMISDELFLWLLAQVRSREQHALSHDTFRHILIQKIPSLPPETITAHSLALFHQLCNLAQIAAKPTTPEVPDPIGVTMDYLWKIALYAGSTEVSLTATQYLNTYYISHKLEREEEFVSRCMSHLSVSPTFSSDAGAESTLLRIHRCLILLKSHLEMFRRRYAYHLRRWSLEGKGVGSHAQLVADKGAIPVRVVLQPAGICEKVTLDMFTTDYVADLRAEVVKWWETVQGNTNLENNPTTNGGNSTPVLGSLLSEGPIRMITQGIELSSEHDEKMLMDVPIKDLQLVYVSLGATRPHKKRDLSSSSSCSVPSFDLSSLAPPCRSKLPVSLLLQPSNFEQLFSLMYSLSELRSPNKFVPNTRAQVLSRRVWDILMLLPTNPEVYEAFKSLESSKYKSLLDPTSPQKLMYCLYIVESLAKQKEDHSWKQRFVDQGGLEHLFLIFSQGTLEPIGDSPCPWSEWKQDCLASLLKILCYLGIVPEETEYLNELLYDVHDTPSMRKRVKRSRKEGKEKTPIPRLNSKMLEMMDVRLVIQRLTNILMACAKEPVSPSSGLNPSFCGFYKTGFWGRAQVVHYAMAFLDCWAFSQHGVRKNLHDTTEFPVWLKKLVLEDPEPVVRREICMGLYRLCLGVSTDGRSGTEHTPEVIAHLLKGLSTALSIRWPLYIPSTVLPSRFVSDISPPISPQGDPSVLSFVGVNVPVEAEITKEPFGPASRDYFWLLARLIDSLDETFVQKSIEDPSSTTLNLDELAKQLRESILSREFIETRHNTVCDEGLIGLISVMCVVMKHNPPFKTSPEGRQFLREIFDCLFALPSPTQRYLPKCKSTLARSTSYDLLAELARFAPENYYLLQSLLIEQHSPGSHNQYPWNYWPHEDGRAPCGFVGLTNLGATCYMASCMQHLYMMPLARKAILAGKIGGGQNRHEQTLVELQRMFAYLMESERKAYNPRGFCKVYQMDHKPLNTGEQKDMAEFFIDLVSKLEEMTPELKKLVKTLFCGVTSNNVVSLDCSHVSRTLEEFYTVRCQVADMRNLNESLDEVTVKDTLEGDNMYTCSTCGKKVRAEKRACFKKLPQVLCFNTMRYTFNMITMMKEKVNTHFSFPIQLDMSGYVEKTLMPQQYQEEREKERAKRETDGKGISDASDPEEECYLYDLIGVTVHTGTADGGHYYSFIRDRIPPNKDKWYLFNDAEVKQFDPSQLPSECFGGEMNTKTYDSVNDKFMDFSFEKTNSAYMLFYERCESTSMKIIPPGPGSSEFLPCLPGGSSHGVPMSMQHPLMAAQPQNSPTSNASEPPPITFELNKELEEWIWLDNTQFLKDRNIFEHTYFNFMSQICCQIPSTLHSCSEDIMILAAKLSASFLMETFIHAKEKPTLLHWMDLLTKQLLLSQAASVWYLEYMAEGSDWLNKILLKCPNQMGRQIFTRQCLHVIQFLRSTQVQNYLRTPDPEPDSDHTDENSESDLSGTSCVTKFIRKYLSLLDPSMKSSSLKYLAEYFGFLNEFTKLGDEECLLLIHLRAISVMVSFYLGPSPGSKREPSLDKDGSGEEEEEEDEMLSIPTEKSKVASLEKMIALIATLVEKSRDETNLLRLSQADKDALMSSSRKTTHFFMFPFILQQIRDGINFTSTRNLIFSLCRWNDRLAEDIVIAIFQAIQKHPDMCHPYFKVLNLLAELVSGPSGMPKFAELILSRILDVSEICPYPTLDWLSAQVPRNKVVHTWCLDSLGTWVEHFLITNNNQRVRNAAASLLVSLVPHPPFRQGYRGLKSFSPFTSQCSREHAAIPPEALEVLHNIYIRLLQLLKPARHYTDVNSHGTSKLISYFGVLTYFTVSKQEKLMFTQFFMDLWNLFHPRLSEPSIPCHHNKSALLTFWHHVCTDCPENVAKIVSNPNIVKQIGFNYILADHEDQEVVQFNRAMLPAYYGILRMCCAQSRQFAMSLARHQNITWAFKNISPFQSQYPVAVEELFKLMQIIIQKPSDASNEESQALLEFKRTTLMLYIQNLDGRSSWTTIISAFRTLVETVEDRIFAVMHGGLTLLFEAIHMLHTMHHEATACNVSGELVDLLSILTELLRSFRPKEFAHGIQSCNNGEAAISRVLSNCKDWPEILKKLATLLNTYNCAELRNGAADALVEFLYTMPIDTLRTLVPLMVHWHTACQEAHSSHGMGPSLGPYFPKRNANSGSLPLKPAVRPPRPMLQMAFPHLGQETAKGLDEEYDRQLQEFYGQYHYFVDLMCRVAFMKDAVNQELITLSAMLGYEAAPLHFFHFPKLWLEVYNTPSIDRKYIMMLVNTNYFTDYVELVILEERTCLTNIVIFNFLATYLPKVFDQIATTDQLCKNLVSIKSDLMNLVRKKMKDVETNAMGILGDLKVLSLFYLPTINGKGSTTAPLPSPAPTIPQLLSVLKQLNAYLEGLLPTLSLNTEKKEAEEEESGPNEEDETDATSPGTLAIPSKKRKVEDSAQKSSDQENQESQKRAITRDLIMLLTGTIDTLIRGISPPGGDLDLVEESRPEEEPKEETETDKQEEKKDTVEAPNA